MIETAQQPPDPRKPAWDAVFAYIRTLPREGERPSLVERNAMIWRAVNAALVALGYPDAEQQAAPAQPEQPDRCPTCQCEDCGGRLDQHAPTGCTCQDCAPDPELACTAFLLPRRITLLAEQLGPLLSSHLHERARRRCLAVAHAAHHALLDYDYPKEGR